MNVCVPLSLLCAHSYVVNFLRVNHPSTDMRWMVQNTDIVSGCHNRLLAKLDWGEDKAVHITHPPPLLSSSPLL